MKHKIKPEDQEIRDDPSSVRELRDALEIRNLRISIRELERDLRESEAILAEIRAKQSMPQQMPA